MKTQNLTKLIFLLGTLTIFSACEKLDSGIGITGQGPMLEEMHHLNEFQNIEIDVNANVYLRQDDAQPVLIKGQANILNNLSVISEHGTLRINYLERVHTHEKLDIYISLPSLINLSTTRSSHIRSMNAFDSERFVFQVYGSGKINMEIGHAQIINTWINGSGEINLEGNTEKLNVVINGSGSVIASGLKSLESNIQLTGPALCKVCGNNSLNVNINGNGRVLYTGNPVNLQTRLSGNGEVHQVL